MKKQMLLVAVLTFSLALAPLLFPARAAKKRVRATSGSRAAVSYSSARLSRGTNSVAVSFQNLTGVKMVEYVLSYAANGVPQGVVGSFTPSGATDGRDLYFGTCSKGVCTPHYGISNASLVIKVVFNNGNTYAKRYKFKRV